jgi:hypothetical protein
VTEEAQKEQTKRAHVEAVAQMRAFMSTPAARAWVMRLIFEYSGVLAGTFTGDALSAAFAEGRRSVGLRVLAEVDGLAPDLLLLARREELDRHDREASERAIAVEKEKHDGSEG